MAVYDRFKLGARVVHEQLGTMRVATVVARPHKMEHFPDGTPVVIDGNSFVTYWTTNCVREVCHADNQPTVLEKFRAR